MDIECYAQRLLNPFRGVVHVIRHAAAEAVTTDGVHWDIYVRNSALVSDLAGARHVQTSDIRYGNWSLGKGLKRGPINPYDDFLDMENMGAIVYEHLLRMHDRLPFPLRDDHEFWLLDRQGRPLALLDSAVAAEDLPDDPPLRWRAGYAAAERFRSPAMAVLETTGETRNAAAYLTQFINACAGDAPAAQWFRRQPDGCGEGLGGVRLPPGLAGRKLEGVDFPHFFLASAGNAAQRDLIADFLDWQAPWLLLLPGLEPAERGRLERQARADAAEVARQYRLYPETTNREEINAALVQAVLVDSQACRSRQADDTVSTFYIELNPAGGEYI